MNIKHTINKLILFELESLGKITRSLKITYDPNMTNHAIERKYRHLDASGELIEDKDIIELIDKSIPILTTELIKLFCL